MRTEQDVRENPQPGDIRRKGKDTRTIEQVSHSVVWCYSTAHGRVIAPWRREFLRWARDAEVVKIGGNE